MSVKSFTLGLGIGILFISAVAVVLFKSQEMEFEKKLKAVEETPISNEDIIQQAKELGMVMYTELPEKEDDTGQSSERSSEYEAEADRTDTLEEDYADRSDDTEAADAYININIPYGTKATQVANELYDAGIIDDADSFKEYLIEKKLTKKIRTGSYRIKQGSTYDEIAAIIRKNQ